jgi:membrane-associated protease RseP (regulator of RpoE activity)
MRREILWKVFLTIAVVMVTTCVDRARAQQLIDPSPGDEGAESAGDLPLPNQSLLVEPPARDHSRVYFGVTFDPNVRDAAVARSVSAGSPADKAGVLAGDTIESLNGTKIGSYDDVLNTIGRLKPGEVLDIEVSRRVSVRVRAVLDGTPVGIEHTTGYRAEAEPLPPPAGLERQTPQLRAPMNQVAPGRIPTAGNRPRPPQGNSATQNRNSNVNRGNSNRNNDDRERDNRGFRGLFRRRG